MGGEEFQSGGAVGGGEYPVSGAFQENLPDAETDGFVVHAQDQMRSVLHKCNTLLGLARSVASIPLEVGRNGCGVKGSEGFIVCFAKGSMCVGYAELGRVLGVWAAVWRS